MNNERIVQGFPSNNWRWQYGPGHGYKGRHAYNIDNPEEAMPVRAVQKVQRGADFSTTLEASLARRDVVLEIHGTYKFSGATWRSVDFQYSTGAFRFIQSLPDNLKIFCTIVGVPIEKDSGTSFANDDYPTAQIIGLGGYANASYYKSRKNFFMNVTGPAYGRFDPILFFTVHYQV